MEIVEESYQTYIFDFFFILFLIYLILKIKLIIRYRDSFSYLSKSYFWE